MMEFILIRVSGCRGGTADRRALVKKAVTVLAKDFELLTSLYVARFIVWRELRKQRREGFVLTWRE